MSNDSGDGFTEKNKSKFFGSIQLRPGASLTNNRFAILPGFGIGMLKTKSTGETYTGLYSNHSETFITPVVSLTGLLAITKHFYAQSAISWYIPTSKQYYSTVGGGYANLTSGLTQFNLGVGYRF